MPGKAAPFTLVSACRLSTNNFTVVGPTTDIQHFGFCLFLTLVQTSFCSFAYPPLPPTSRQLSAYDFESELFALDYAQQPVTPSKGQGERTMVFDADGATTPSRKGTMHNVPGDFATVQDAIDAAHDGDVRVLPACSRALAYARPHSDFRARALSCVLPLPPLLLARPAAPGLVSLAVCVGVRLCVCMCMFVCVWVCVFVCVFNVIVIHYSSHSRYARLHVHSFARTCAYIQKKKQVRVGIQSLICRF